MKNKQCLFVIPIFLAIASQVACSANATKAVETDFPLADLITRIASGVPQGLRTQVAAASFRSYYETLRAATSDAAFTVGGVTITGVRSRIQAAAAEFAALDGAYSSIGASGALGGSVAKNLQAADIRAAATAMLHDFAATSATLPKTYTRNQVSWGAPKGSDQVKITFKPGSPAAANLAALFALAWARQLQAPSSLALTAALPGSSAVTKLKDACGSSSGTFVNHCQMVTAAHAVIGQAGLRNCQPGGPYADAITAVPNPKFAGTIDTAHWDTAVVTFPDNTSTQWVEPNFEPLAAGTEVNAAGHPLGGEGRCQTGTIDQVYETGLLSINGLTVVGLPGGSGGYVGDGQLRGVLSASNDAANPTETFVAPMSANEDFIRQNTLPTN